MSAVAYARATVANSCFARSNFQTSAATGRNGHDAWPLLAGMSEQHQLALRTGTPGKKTRTATRCRRYERGTSLRDADSTTAAALIRCGITLEFINFGLERLIFGKFPLRPTAPGDP